MSIQLCIISGFLFRYMLLIFDFFSPAFFYIQVQSQMFWQLSVLKAFDCIQRGHALKGIGLSDRVAWMSVGGLATPHSLLSTQLTDKLFLIMTLQTIIPAKN